ncbi:MAG: PmoA family protein [Candidatus Nealsonbacteria bacterium]|nr:PmoA family protein [Candidatus Nealsonbacteria bacterium]
MSHRIAFPVLAAVTCFPLLALAAESQLPDAKPVQDVQVLPLPYDQSSFEHDARELTRYHYGPALKRPFWYPLIGPPRQIGAGRSLTRMGHPRDPHTHSHHNSVWISHHDVAGVDFWSDRPGTGRIVHQYVKQYEDGDKAAWMLSLNAWQDGNGKTLMNEWRRTQVEPGDKGNWLMLIDLQLEAPATGPVTIGQNPFGLIGVRMAKTIGVHDGGGRILNSQGQLNEGEVFRKPARWVDYSGPVTKEDTGGITLMDHPANPGHPTPFHVRGDGWMGACLTLNRPLTIEPGKPLRLRYALWIHAGVPKVPEIDARWKDFAARGLPQPPATTVVSLVPSPTRPPSP